MINRQRLALLIVVSACIQPSFANTASDAFKHGTQAEHQANYDAAATYYKQAYTAVPGNAKYFAAYTRVRFSAGQHHVHSGQLLLNTGSLKEALAEFQRAVEIDSSSFIAQQELRRAMELMRRKDRQQSSAKSEPSVKVTDELADSVELKTLSTAPITLRMTANSDVVYKTISKLAGINLVMDPDFRPQKIAVDLADVTLRQALDMVRLQSKTYWRPVLANTIYVAADSTSKRKELELNVMKTFYLQNITTPAELQEAANLVRQILDITRVQLLQSQDGLIIRGTPDQLVLAEKLLADFDKPKSEVIIDVAVMEVSRDRIRTLGTTVPTTASVSLLPGLSGGSSTAASSGSTSAAGVFNLGNIAAISVSGGSFTFLATDSNTKILQSPEIRALNDQKATLRIGDRVPIATGSFQPGIGGGGVSPLVSTQFQYLDVGVNIDIVPHIHANHEVTLKMMLEISSVSGSETIGGITQPIIGQRRIDLETRVADGEVNLLGGILEDSETQSMSGYPWVSRIPILKYLFAQDNTQRTNNEIVFAITPHIVRSREVTEENGRAIEVGTGNTIELRRKAPTTAASTPAAAAATPEHPADPPKPQQQPAPKVLPPNVPAAALPRPSAVTQASSQSKPAGTQ